MTFQQESRGYFDHNEYFLVVQEEPLKYWLFATLCFSVLVTLVTYTTIKCSYYTQLILNQTLFGFG